jgi:hypothetical protein
VADIPNFVASRRFKQAARHATGRPFCQLITALGHWQRIKRAGVLTAIFRPSRRLSLRKFNCATVNGKALPATNGHCHHRPAVIEAGAARRERVHCKKKGESQSLQK